MKVEVTFKVTGPGQISPNEPLVFEKEAKFFHQMWSKEMRTYTIEARVDFQDPEKYEIFLEIMRTTARDAMASALMLRDKREPQVAFSTGDMYSKDENLELISPEDATPRGE